MIRLAQRGRARSTGATFERKRGMTAEAAPFRRAKASIRDLYEGGTPQAHRFRYGLLVFDLVVLLFIVATSFAPRNDVVEMFDVLFGVIMLADFSARLYISRHRLRDLAHPVAWTDIAAIVSFLAPLIGEAAGFLRILRTLRLLRSVQLLTRLRRDFDYFRANEEIIIAVANFVVFVFIMTGLVYETQRYSNPTIGNYADALYFTVTALTTTGFGDITLPGTTGRLISVMIMIFGVTLFFGLARAVLRPNKVRFSCPTCGLLRHEPDAVHCKACGELLNIPNED
jgi:voltage-gated potassium channel